MTEAQAIADMAAQIDGASWAVSSITSGVIATHHPDRWIWMRTQRTLGFALEGYIVTSRRPS